MHFSYLIIGAGPAGVQLSYFLSRAGIDHMVVERASEAGAFFRQYPRHRKLLSINKVHTGYHDPETNLRWDWNSLLSDDYQPQLGDRTDAYFPDADAFVDYMAEYVDRHGIQVRWNTTVERVERPSEAEPFRVMLGDAKELTCDRLVVATGLYKGWTPEIPGIEICERYTTMSVDPRDFVGQRVLIVGKGNSGFETADNLVATAASIHLSSPRPVRFAWQTHFVGDLRAVNNNVLDTYQLKSQNAILDASIVDIARDGEEIEVTFAYAHANGEVEKLRYDRVLLCTGFRFDDAIFGDGCRPALTDCGRLPRMTSQWESENVPGMFFAGTLMQYRDYKKYMSSFIHGFRYNVRALSRMLERRFHGRPWPARGVPLSVDEVADLILARSNRSSALWQQPGFLTDVIWFDARKQRAVLYEEMPVDFAREELFHSGEWLSITLEYGKNKAPNPFNIERVHREDAKRAADSTFLHPVVRHYQGAELVHEHHVLEDLAAEWRESEHIEPLREMCRRSLEGFVGAAE